MIHLIFSSVLIKMKVMSQIKHRYIPFIEEILTQQLLNAFLAVVLLTLKIVSSLDAC